MLPTSTLAMVGIALLILNGYSYIQARQYVQGKGPFNILLVYAGGAIGALFGLHLVRRKEVAVPKNTQIQVLILAVTWSLMILILV